jgi:transglutaminase-like putative cysteine protease
MPELEHAAFLGSCAVIDWSSRSVRELALQLAQGNEVATVRVVFEWVRDRVAHTADAGHGKITLRASEVLRERTGLCYAKSHLLVALLRASGIPAGLCYQRLRLDDDAASFCLHGMVGVLMPDKRFLRIDPRGNKPGVVADFAPSSEALAFKAEQPGEADLPGVFARPVPEVVAALAEAGDWNPLRTKLPDVAPERWPIAEANWE